MTLIIDKQCVYKTVDKERKQEKETTPKNYLKLTCPLALFANKSSSEGNIPFITSDELSHHFDNFFPGKEQLTNTKKSPNDIKISIHKKEPSKKITNKYYSTPGGKKTKTKTRKK